MSEPSLAVLSDLAIEQFGLDFDEDPEAVARLAAIGLTNGAWRNTSLEDLHAGDHPSGGFPDADMMRFNIATFRTVSRFVSAKGVEWAELRDALTDPQRVLPGDLTVETLAGDGFERLAGDIDGALRSAEQTEKRHGLAYALTRFGLHGGMACKGWYGTPWWPDVVDAFIDLLANPSSGAWRYDDRSKPEPALVSDREALKQLLLGRPEALDDDGIYWCLDHGLDHDASHHGFVRWRAPREPSWIDPMPWLTEG